MDDAQQLEDLRGKLERRNVLLDVIRKAYHRDVISVNVEASLGASLASVPSVDLRETFRLFAPHECELRVRPCWTCGGQLEVIHRESSRIVNLKHAICLLEEKEKDLRLGLVQTKVDAQGDRDRLVEVVEKSKEERDVLLEQILALKREVADRNALEAEVRRLKSDKQTLEATLEQQQPILVEHERLVVEVEEVKVDAEQWKTQYHEQVERNAQLEAEKESLSQQLNLLRGEYGQLTEDLVATNAECRASSDHCSALTQDLADTNAAKSEVEACLRTTEHALEELECDFRREKQRAEGRIGDLESQCSEMKSRIEGLEDESRKHAEEASRCHRKIVSTLEGARRRGSIAFVPRSSEAAFAKTDELICELESQRHKTAALFNLLLGCIRSTYENCLVQEKLLVDNGSELHQNDRKLEASDKPTNDRARMVLGHLDNADESDLIEWSIILKNETDQRHILGNLQNRLQMGQFSLDKAFQQVYKTHSVERLKCQEKHDEQLEERRSRIWELEQQLSESLRLNRLYEDKMTKMRAKCESVESEIELIRGLLRKLRREARDNNDTIAALKADHATLRTLANRLLSEWGSAKKRTLGQDSELAERRQDIENRDAAISQLETLLQTITQRYAENERARIKVTHEVSVQAVAEVAERSSHADFLPTPLRRGGAVDAAENRENKRHALLPGRIFSIDKGWRPTAINYRRVIDKL